MTCASKRSDYLIIRVLLTILSVTKIIIYISLAFHEIPKDWEKVLVE